MPLEDRDYKLSMNASPRARDPQRNKELRSMIVHRLRDAAKAVVRLPNKTDINTAHAGHYAVHCEPCVRWFPLPAWGEEIECPHCGGLFALELAVFSAIERGDG